MKIDPDALTAAGDLGQRQGTHLATISHYVRDVCDRRAAFCGVLRLFAGAYTSALTAAGDGYRGSVTVADKTHEALHATRDDLLATDRSVAEAFAALHPDAVPYRYPGGGDSTYGPGADPGDPDPVSDEWNGPRRPGDLRDPLPNGVIPDNADPDPVPGWLRGPGGQLEERRDEWLARGGSLACYDEYRELRGQGLTAQEAHLQVDRPQGWSADQARQPGEQQAEQRAYDDARLEALLSGATPDEAETAGDSARDDRAATHERDDRDRDRAGDAAGTGWDAWSEADDSIDHLAALQENGEELGDTLDDLEGYHAFESTGRDPNLGEDVAEWARS